MRDKLSKSTKAKFLSALSCGMVLICALALLVVNYANRKLNQAKTDQMDLVVYADTFGDTSSFLTNQVRFYAATGDRQYYDNYWNEVNTAKNREKYVAAMQEVGLEDSESAMITRIAELSDSLIPLEEEAMACVEQGDLEKALDILFGTEYEKGAEEIKTIIARFNEDILKRTQKTVDRITGFVTLFTICAYIASFIIFVVLVYLVYFILRELIDPIIKIKDKMIEFSEGKLSGDFDIPIDNTEIGITARAMRELQNFQMEIINDIDYLLLEMSKGNFTVDTRCERNYKGDYQNIIKSLKAIITHLSMTLSEINKSAEQVNTGADQVAAAAQGLSQGATQQASSLEELSASIAEVSAKIKANAENAGVASRISNESGEGVIDSNRRMKELMGAMGDIRNTSYEISNIIKTIDDIAFQTNILALNAAVEAARAGTAGKGFAVVADEVRNLAGKSAEAAQNTTALIESTVNAVENGVSKAKETAEYLEQVVGKVKTVDEKIREIAVASEEQSMVVSQITVGVDQISSVVQTNSATSEESAAASEELSGQANMLKELVGKFQLHAYNTGSYT